MARTLGILAVVLILAAGAFVAWQQLRPKQVQFDRLLLAQATIEASPS